MKKAEYKNSIRSKQLIKAAYFDLLLKKEPSKITVTDIVDSAGINRGTFYAHYDDINSLISSVEEEFINELYNAMKKLDKHHTPRDVINEITMTISQNREFYKKIISISVYAPFIQKLQKKFVEYMEQNENIDRRIRSSNEFKIRARFFASGAASLYTSWLSGEIACSADYLTDMLNQLIIDDTILFK